ncbi:MAG: 50S ribosomal protein L11 methyltransferase [Clostridia bacterium]|nr:50S ribosomal protein L11 methyltransferase [Clostridia bacterium]
MNWIELVIHTTTAGSDLVSECLMEFGASGTMIEDRADIPDPSKPHGIWEIIDPRLLENMPEDVLVHAWFPPDESFPLLMDRLRARLARMTAEHSDFGSLRMDTRTVSEDSWTEVWKKFYKPFYVGDHLVVKPTWEDFTAAPGDKIIEIDPGMAFGSGTHETTGMCISLLQEIIRGGERVIDVGTGSGILAIAAALLGAGSVLAVDIDPDAVRVASENVRHNHVDSVITVREGDLLKSTDETCDICVTNIISDIIIAFARPLMDHIVPGGLFVCSGIVKERTEEVRTALLEAGFEIIKTVFRGEWVAFLSGRKA